MLGRDDFSQNTINLKSIPSDKIEITDALTYGEYKPLYIRVKNPHKPNTHFAYYLPVDRNLEIFDPFEEREKSKDIRIYLKFVNTGQHADNIDYNIHEFLNQYGFFGENDSSFDNALIKALTIDKQFYYPNFIVKKHDILLDMFENKLRQYKKPKLENKYGYYEDTNTIHHCYLRDFEGRINVLERITYFPDSLGKHEIESYYTVQEQINWINICMSGIKTYYNAINGKIISTFGYQSLISLMYLEFLFDIKNNIIARKCSKCHLYSLPETKVINKVYVCPGCLNNN